MQVVEEGISKTDYGYGDDVQVDHKSAIYWRSMLKKYRDAREAIEEQKKIKQEVIEHYAADIEKRIQHLESIENYIKANIHAFARRTKSGALSIDHFPDIGTLSLAKPKISLKPDPEYWADKFKKTTITFDLQRFKAKYNLIDGKIVDKDTGELVNLPNVAIETKQVLSFRKGGE